MLISGFTFVSFAQVPAKDCSSFTPDYYVPVGTPVNLSVLVPGSSVTNKTFVLDDDLIIDKFIAFQNCLFKIAPGKRIKISTEIIKTGKNIYDINVKGEGAYNLFDMNGKMVRSGKVTPYNHYLDLNSLKPGIYFLQLEHNNSANKIIIEP